MDHNKNHQNGYQAAETSLLRGISPLWIIPLVTVLAGLWMVYDHLSSQGPLITLEFMDADGLVEGKTKIKTRSIDVGVVVSIHMSKETEGVIIKARMEPEVAELLTEDSRFWVTKPVISLAGVSGLGTLLSGQHIEFTPGNSKQLNDHFEALETPPLTPSGTPGIHLTLDSKADFSYSEGDAILYQGFKVGKIEDIYFNSDERMMYYNVFIQAPYHKLITSNTRFWDSSGIRAEVTSSGVSVDTGNLESLLIGGISFGLPDGQLAGVRVTERAYFKIYPSRSQTGEEDYQQTLSYILLVDNSIPGLESGNPVIIRGIKVGEVVQSGDIPVGGSLLDLDLMIPIKIELNPARMGMADTETGRDQAEEELLLWLKKGMSATVKSTSPLFGQQIIELRLPRKAIETEIVYYENMPVITVNTDGFDDITEKLNQIVDKINSIPITEIGNNLEQLLSETTEAVSSIEELATQAGSEELVRSLNQTTIQIGELAASYSTNSPSNREIQLALENLTHVLAELSPLLTELKNKPNGFIFTSNGKPEAEPKSKSN